MATHNDFGKWGEDFATEYLRGKGYVILERDWKSGHRDIDIIALKENVVVFVEVKTRKSRQYQEPIEAVGYHKLQNIQQAINHYIKSHPSDFDFRFDIVTIVAPVHTAVPEIEHFEDVRLF